MQVIFAISLFSQISDVVWQALIAAAMTLVLTWMSQRTKAAVEKTSKEAAEKVEGVKNTLRVNTAATEANTAAVVEKLDGIAKVSEKTHTLVNSNMAVQLQLNAAVSRRLADITKDPADIEAAVLAERLHHEHETKQKTVDAKDAKDAKN